MSKKINNSVIEFDSLEEIQKMVKFKYGNRASEFGILNKSDFDESLLNSVKYYSVTFRFPVINTDDYDISIRDLVTDNSTKLVFICAANKDKHKIIHCDTKARLKYDNTHCCLIMSSNMIKKIKGVAEVILAQVPITQRYWFDLANNFNVVIDG